MNRLLANAPSCPKYSDDVHPLERIREQANALRRIHDALKATTKGSLYFPFELSDKRPPRAMQGYLAKLPAMVLELFDEDSGGALLRGLDETSAQSDAKPSHRRGLGVEYRRADESSAVTERDPFSIDPALVERGVRGHASTQNALADYLRAQGVHPRSPAAHEPNFDLAWTHNDRTFVAEVKSTTDVNEEKQLRLGLGQVLRYANVMRSGGNEIVLPVLVPEREPRDVRWNDLCESVGVWLVWPGSFARLFP